MIEKRLSDATLHCRRWWFVFGLSLIMLLLYGSLAPAKALPRLSGSDKAWHAGTYCILMAYFSQIYSGVRARALVAAALIALFIAIEFIQPYVDRQFDWLDALANSIGVFAGLALTSSRFSQIITRVGGLFRHRFG